MPCYDDRDRQDREATAIASAVRGFLLCKALSVGNQAQFVEMQGRWFIAHRHVDRMAEQDRKERTTASYRALESARHALREIEKDIHTSLVNSKHLEKI